MALAAAGWEDMKVGVVRAVSKKRPPENIWSGLRGAGPDTPGQMAILWLGVPGDKTPPCPRLPLLVAICSSLSETGTCLQEVMVPKEYCLWLKRGEGERERAKTERGEEERDE